MTKCPKCGYDNPMEAKYCLNCGFKLAQEEKYKLEAEGMLLIASGIILLLTLLFNALIKILPLLSLIYLVFGITKRTKASSLLEAGMLNHSVLTNAVFGKR
ncbi:MAG: zinc ribbon domain-containing protein [Nitrososphaeria archaeon]